MFDVRELLSKRNKKDAFKNLQRKGQDKINGKSLKDFQDYWSMNEEIIQNRIINGTYEPDLIKVRELINGNGKRRSIVILSNRDRFICKLLSQKLTRYLDPLFLSCSFAFRENKGIQAAVEQCKIYLQSGCKYVVNIDIKDFFDSIDHKRMNCLIDKATEDEAVKKLINTYISCNIEVDNRVVHKDKGLLQGNSISPVLSNLYLNELDEHMEERGYCWVRYSDDINVYTDDLEEAGKILEDISLYLQNIGLNINDKKSGIFDPFNRIYLGYDFYHGKEGVEIKKHIYQKTNNYHYWHDSAIEKVNHEYHLIKNGVINKKDYSLLFESDKEKYNIPVEVAEQINVYNSVTFAADALKFISQHGIRIAYISKYGEPDGYYLPQKSIHSNTTLVNQFKKYVDEKERIQMARKMEIAGFHNMRSNLRYYNKKNNIDLTNEIESLSNFIVEANEVKTVEGLLLTEARCRQQYYKTFNKIINNKDFEFSIRTKRPPKDCINALISFLNTVLYNEILLLIYKTTLDPRIGIIHSTTRRNFTLNLDFADLFKPLIVDRVIFTLINTKQVKADKHFEKIENDGLYLNDVGKRIVIERFEEKLNSSITIKDKTYTYRQIIEKDIYKYLNYINKDTEYKPYKYY